MTEVRNLASAARDLAANPLTYAAGAFVSLAVLRRLVRSQREYASSRLERPSDSEEKKVGYGSGEDPGGVSGTAAEIVPETGQGKRRNRAKTGKRSNPDYVMAGAHIHRDVRYRVEKALVSAKEPGKKKPEYSELVEGLLRRWLDEIGY